MATLRACEACGAGPAKAIKMTFMMEGVAHPDKPTAIELVADSCEACQEHCCKVLAVHAVEMIREQAPYHATMELADHEREGHQAEFNGLKDELLEDYVRASRAASTYAEKNPGKPKPEVEAFLDSKLVARRDDLLAKMQACEDKRTEAAIGGTVQSDERIKLFVADLKGKRT